MHMSDALVSIPIAGLTTFLSVSILYVAIRKVKDDTQKLPLMGVMGAFIFAAQMINFTIPGTGASGHLMGGILLAALLGPWAGFLTLSSVLIIQCLLFADGGVMALGCNILNMAVCSCLIVYPLVFRPIAGQSMNTGRLFLASIIACNIALILGATMVTLETEASGVTSLPIDRFLLFMIPIHWVIGIGEGLATGAVLSFLARFRPEVLQASDVPSKVVHQQLWMGIVLAIVLGVCGYYWASTLPDGLEWSIEKTIEG